MSEKEMLAADKERIVKANLDKINWLAKEITAKIVECLIGENMTGAEIALALYKVLYTITKVWVETEKETIQQS